MFRIQVLDKHTAELIAAGEVVERPSSVVKELMENAIDAGASMVTVEIENGGVRLIRITDDGAGILREDVPSAFLRHATSKVRVQDDLDAIGTLGFRGEALASLCAVSRVELLTGAKGETAGTRYQIEGGEEGVLEDAAHPQGTTIIVRDLFYNVPARMKFLKKDVTEANAAAGVADRIALSHPAVSVRFIRDGTEELLTPGDGQLLSCIYAVLGREFAGGLLPVDYTLDGIRVHGFISKPSAGRANRTMQYFFINGRYVKSRTAMAALEQAFKGSVMTGKFPTCVLHIDMPLETVDVNVHPAKIEVRFVNEKPVFSAVYHAVKAGLHTTGAPPSIKIPAPKQEDSPFSQIQFSAGGRPTARTSAVEIAAQPLPSPSLPEDSPPEKQEPSYTRGATRPSPPFPPGVNTFLRDSGDAAYNRPVFVPDILYDEPEEQSVQTDKPLPSKEQESGFSPPPAVRYLGEAFSTYLIAEQGDSLYLIDKHAAHERILYDQFRSTPRNESQLFLSPASVTLSREEYAALLPMLDTLQAAGFEVEDFGGHSMLVRGVPMMLDQEDAAHMLREIAGGLVSGRREITTDKLDWTDHSAACRAAVKAGDKGSPAEWQALAERVLLHQDVRTCPHGRPVCFELTRRELEKQFGRSK